MKKFKLSDQLIAVGIFIVGIIIISLGIILPKNLLPVYEKNIYNYLKQPLEFIEDDITKGTFETEIAYLYVTNENNVLISENLTDIINYEKIDEILSKFTSDYGKFIYKTNVYYYNTSKTPLVTKIAITDDTMIRRMRREIFDTMFVIVGITFIITIALLMLWSNNLVKKIRKLKDKVDNLNNDNFDHKITLKNDDELYSLAMAIENMRIYLKEQEEYKNQMYQNISHDFKTPITVMKSYIEASEDGMETKEKALEVIKNQIERLEIKVHSLLYLNKINYIKDKKDNLKEKINVQTIINASVEKFKMVRPDVTFDVFYDKKQNTFRGSSDMWEAIIDNILGNFVRYADKKIKVTIKNNKITLYNDGPNIDKNIINNLFTPYEKGVNGVFGLGLSIVQKTLRLLEYEITIENQKKGVMFTIR